MALVLAACGGGDQTTTDTDGATTLVSDAHDQVRISGVAIVETDGQVLDELWQSNPLLRKYLGSQDNPELVIYRIEPNSVRFMREWALQYHDVPLD